MLRRQRTPLLIGAFISASALFIGLKWRAVVQRSEAAKKAGQKDVNYSVAPGRSGECLSLPLGLSMIPQLCEFFADVFVQQVVESKRMVPEQGK
jgi:hypothetical protein